MWSQKLANILGRYVLILCFVIKYIRTYEDITPKSWQGIMKNFKNKVDDIFDGNNRKPEEAHSGKFFKYILPKENGNEEFEAFEDGKSHLPRWLSFESRKRKLHGVPTDEDIRSGIKIVFRRKHENTVNGLIGEKKYIIINVYNNKEPFICEYDEKSIKKGADKRGVITTGSIIFAADISKANGRKRVRLLRKIAQQLDQSITSLYLEVGNRLSNDVALQNGIRMAGPGDRVTVDAPGFTVTWKIKCAKDIAGDQNIGQLGELSSREDFSSTFKDPVMGWFVHTSEDGGRYRRAVPVGGTPVATPAVTGTPTISPSPSVVVSPTMIKPSKSAAPVATTSVVVAPPVVVTTAAPTPAPTTQEITTTPPLTTTEQPTTEKPTTEQPTTQKPTTVAPTTEDPTTQPPVVTQAPTTKSPVVTTVDSPITNDDISVVNVDEHSIKEVNLKNVFIYDQPLTITLLYYPKGDQIPIPSTNKDWIEYHDNKLYILPKNEHLGEHTFAVKGTSDSGKYALANFRVNVQKDTKLYNFLFNMTLTLDVSQSARQQVTLIKSIAAASNQERDTIRAVRVAKGAGTQGVVVWSLNDANFLSCRNVHVDDYMKLIRSDEFNQRFDFEASVYNVDMVVKKEVDCGDPPIVVGPSAADDGLWQRILIPVIVIVILLLIIALILCCVYRRKRKANVQIEEDKAYLNHKKPVIFLEEFDEKPHFVSLQPLILPNEKPPTPGGPYEPEGPGSSTTVSTESEEKPLTPQSPKESSRKGYNAPPPYNSL